MMLNRGFRPVDQRFVFPPGWTVTHGVDSEYMTYTCEWDRYDIRRANGRLWLTIRWINETYVPTQYEFP